MSNEYIDWFKDAMQDVVLGGGLADKTFYPSNTRIVDGIKNGQPVRYEVWLDDLEGWKVKRREIDK